MGQPSWQAGQRTQSAFPQCTSYAARWTTCTSGALCTGKTGAHACFTLAACAECCKHLSSPAV